MKASEKFKNVFGSINHLSETIPWTSGVLNMVEHLVWDTRWVLGVSKTEYWKTAVRWACSDELKDLPMEDKFTEIKKNYDRLLKDSDSASRYAKTTDGIYTAREAMRQMKYFSEDYLNKEFDIFMNLASDRYLDYLYGPFIEFKPGSPWSSHGNSSFFGYSAGIESMQMDNLAYNDSEKLLVANELKLGGRKNRDQIIKYCYMFQELENRQFIREGSKFVLLFISDKEESFELDDELDKEITYLKKRKRFDLLKDEILSQTKKLALRSITWRDLININNQYLRTLDERYQVEVKLLQGFNATLKDKGFVQME